MCDPLTEAHTLEALDALKGLLDIFYPVLTAAYLFGGAISYVRRALAVFDEWDRL